MDVQALNVDLFKKLSLAVTIIRNTPAGIKPEAFTRSLAKRVFPPPTRANQLASMLDEYLVLRQDNLLARLRPLPPPSSLAASISFMDLSSFAGDSPRKVTNEYEHGDFADKVLQLKDRNYTMKVADMEFLLGTLLKWITSSDVDQRALPTDACLYTIQLIANHLKTDTEKPYHIVLGVLPMIDTFLDGVIETIERARDETHVASLQQMIVSLASSNSCVTRVLDKLCTRLHQHCDQSDPLFASPIDRLFNVLHEIVHNRSIFQRRLSQRSVEKLLIFINQVSTLLDGTSNYAHRLKLEGQLQAANYTPMVTFRSYPSSSSSSEHSQCQKPKHPIARGSTNTPDYSQSQHF